MRLPTARVVGDDAVSGSDEAEARPIQKSLVNCSVEKQDGASSGDTLEDQVVKGAS